MSEAQKDIGRQSKYAILIVIGLCMVVGYIGLSYLTSNSEHKSQVSGLNNNSPAKTEETPNYSELLNNFNKQKAAEAKETGESYISVPSSKAEQVELSGKKEFPSQTQTAPQPQQQAQTGNTTKELDPRVFDMIKLWDAETHETARKSEDGASYAKSLFSNQETQQGYVQTSSTASTESNRPAIKIVEDFATVPAILKTDIDTDENSEVRASVQTGKYAGAELYALGYKRLNNSVDMTFTFMTFKGRSYKITAKAIDPNTERSALSGEVNNRYISRIILPSIASGIAKGGQMYEQSNTQTVITPQGGIVQTSPSGPTAAAIRGAVVGGMAGQTAQVMSNDAANMPVKQVLIAKNITIGIRFMGPVLSTDELAPGASELDPQKNSAFEVLGSPASQPARQANPASTTLGNGTNRFNFAQPN